jgi:hypothetical protein
VRQFSDQGRAQSARQERLDSVLQEAREKARALGFDDAEILQRISSMAHQHPVACHVAFVDKVPHAAAKYARLVETHLQGAVRATPLSVAEIEERSARAVSTLSRVFHIVTVARNVPFLERTLPSFEAVHNIVTIVAEVLPVTTTALSSLTPDTRAVLLTEEHYLYSSLNLVAMYSELDPQDVGAFTLPDTERFLEAARSADVVLYTFGVSDVLDSLGLPEQGIGAPLMELAFDIGPDSVRKLQGVFGVGEAGAVLQGT